MYLNGHLTRQYWRVNRTTARLSPSGAGRGQRLKRGILRTPLLAETTLCSRKRLRGVVLQSGSRRQETGIYFFSFSLFAFLFSFNVFWGFFFSSFLMLFSFTVSSWLL